MNARGTFHEPRWRRVEDAPPSAELEARPSLWAALDVPFKALGTLAAFLLPAVVTGGFVAGDPFAALSLFVILELVQVVPAFLLAFAPAVRILFTRYSIDDEGVRVTTQVLARQDARVAWEKVTAIRHRVTLIDRLFGIQRVDIIAYGERGTTLRLVGLRDAKRVRDLAAAKMRQHASLGALLSGD